MSQPEKFDMEEQSSKNKQNQSWLSRQSTCTQLLLVVLPIVALSAAVITLGVLLDQEIRRGWEQSQKIPDVTTPKPDNMKVCETTACVAAAGSILASMNQKIDPCVDFYNYTCGGFEREQNIPSGYTRYGSFDKADNLVQKNLREILETPGPAGEREARAKARRYYKACMDTAKIDAEGKARMQNMVGQFYGGFYLKTSSQLPGNWDLVELLDKRHAYTTDGFFAFYVSEDNKKVSENVLQVTQGGLGLGSNSRDYYIGKNVESDPNLVAYVTMLQSYAQIIAGSDAVERQLVEDVVRFEQELATTSLPKSLMRDYSTQYNMQTIRYLQQNFGFMNWLDFFHRVFGRVKSNPPTIDENEKVLMFATEYFKNLTGIMTKYLSTDQGRRVLHNYVVFHAVMDYASRMGSEFQKASDAFQAVFYGKQGSLPRWETCVGDTDGSVGFGLGALYIDDYFTPEGRDQALGVLGDVTAAFEQRIKDVDWMDEPTKVKALEKIAKLKYQAAYPDYVRDDDWLDSYYNGLTVSDSYVDNQFNDYTFAYEDAFNILRKSPDTDIWFMNPQTVNAYYSPTQNKFVVPGGILTPPFFYQATEMPPAINFAAIGTVTGHEIGHGFDDSGSQYDGDGNMNNWWSAETRAEFDKKAQCLIDQYEKYEVNGEHLRGKQTLGENIGDNGGLRASYQAYRTFFPNDNSVLAGMTHLNSDQLFFVAYAQVWCSLYTPESMRSQILTNVHSPGPFRVIGPVSNSPDFAKAFKCPLNSPMNPENKCEVW